MCTSGGYTWCYTPPYLLLLLLIWLVWDLGLGMGRLPELCRRRMQIKEINCPPSCCCCRCSSWNHIDANVWPADWLTRQNRLLLPMQAVKLSRMQFSLFKYTDPATDHLWPKSLTTHVHPLLGQQIITSQHLTCVIFHLCQLLPKDNSTTEVPGRRKPNGGVHLQWIYRFLLCFGFFWVTKSCKRTL